MPRYCTLQQAARQARVHTMVIYWATRAGRLHTTQEHGLYGEKGEMLIHNDCLAAWLDDRHCEHPDPKAPALD
ncbi:hypothetical protein PU560_04540 [Georgenia sp. 10Sc9-8]|uniref:DNA-binding protein n=1 Tax=Georgenia halotolerans TaxID=3028317 RepID=A0ABT5TX54_9MICO|nr:hypothetical protein [Georgenia halotolerans]